MRALAIVCLLAGAASADEPTYIHAELDPLTFALSGYGGQVGFRFPQLHGVRLAVASFSLDVPDAISNIHGNDGFDEKIRPCGAVYGLYYFNPPGHDGFAAGVSVRYLRLEFQHDNVDGVADIKEISPEAIIAYQWHPFDNGFYLQPWLALGVTVWRDHDAVVGNFKYDELPVNPFFTINIGYEQPLTP
ncbi:MAG TPA: hypothetical protein VGC41_25485 [Kofleriaceae bacterium]